METRWTGMILTPKRLFATHRYWLELRHGPGHWMDTETTSADRHGDRVTGPTQGPGHRTDTVTTSADRHGDRVTGPTRGPGQGTDTERPGHQTNTGAGSAVQHRDG